MLHQGERTVQRLAGVTIENWGSSRVGATIPPVAAAFLSKQRMVVVGAAADDGTVWASALTGPPGFVVASDDRTVVVHRLPSSGDPIAGLFDTGRDLGMLAVEPVTHRRMRVNGHARRDGDGLVIRTEQVYANCQKYIQTRTLADSDLPPTARVTQVGTALNDEQRRWIAAADTFFVATHASGLGTDASHRGGSPGFVVVSGNRRLTWPDYVGNSMYMTLGNLELDSHCGLLFLDWEHGHTLQVTGQARVSWDSGRASSVPGAQRVVDFDVERVVQVDGASPLRWSFEEYSRFNPT